MPASGSNCGQIHQKNIGYPLIFLIYLLLYSSYFFPHARVKFYLYIFDDRTDMLSLMMAEGRSPNLLTMKSSTLLLLTKGMPASVHLLSANFLIFLIFLIFLSRRKWSGVGDHGGAYWNGYFYLWYSNSDKETVGVARSTTGLPGSWYKYYQGSFSSPGIYKIKTTYN